MKHAVERSAVAFAAAAFLASPIASAQSGLRDRHPTHLLSPKHKPAGVPDNYVLTHSGFFHPSCVITQQSDEVTGEDLVIRGLDGSEHDRIAPCAYPSYGRGGRPRVPAHAPPVQAAQVLYDGYIVYYAYDGAVPVGPTLTTDWTVPLAPTNVSDQDIAFFNDILTSAGGGDILQPVLDFNGEVRNSWAMESEHCCISGNDMQTTPVTVNVGDKIRGIVVGSNCASDGVCQSWAVTTTDVTTGGTTTLNTTAPSGVPNGISPGSLETYGVTSCDMFPASNQLTFSNNQLTSADGTKQLNYHLLILDGANAEVPTDCGYAGLTSGNDYTLIWGKVTTGGAGGSSAGGASAGGASAGSGGKSGGGASSGGSSGGAAGVSAGGATASSSGGASSGAGASSTAGAASVAGASSAGANGAAGSLSAGGSGGSSPGGNASGASGAGTKTGTGGAAGSSAGQAGAAAASDNSGCSCELARSRSSLALSVGLLAAALALFRRRRSR